MYYTVFIHIVSAGTALEEMDFVRSINDLPN